MDNAQKAIMLGVGLFITIIVIAAVMAITGIGQDLINSSQSQLSGISGQLATQMQSKFNSVKMNGTQVKSYIAQYYNDASIAMYLVSEKVSSSTTTGMTIAKDSMATTGKGTLANPWLCSLVYIKNTGSASTVLDKGTSQYGAGFAGFTIKEAQLDSINSSSRPNLNDLNGAISSTSQYISVLVTDESTGNVLGVVFLRYQ